MKILVFSFDGEYTHCDSFITTSNSIFHKKVKFKDTGHGSCPAPCPIY